MAGGALVVMGLLAALAVAGRRVPGGRLVTVLPQRSGWRAIALGVGCGAAALPHRARAGSRLGHTLASATPVLLIVLGAVLLAGAYDGIVQRLVIGT